ncbi:hypothetical protein LEP1GSC035_0239 [Leptospira noguchii str. 2007001578]|uniref:Uncharacterized protein n=1 Tax=Leptospira noguchii str. 2007001578 TaxID=1049974 RepID=A0ABN0J3X1_9LEPT|nr:hypothetical protein LEP1GSC035_0239 [Leptospira noguchii str. 2007001578]
MRNRLSPETSAKRSFKLKRLVRQIVFYNKLNSGKDFVPSIYFEAKARTGKLGFAQSFLRRIYMIDV